jgi:hypothetical protein
MRSMNHEPDCVNLAGTQDNPITGLELLPTSNLPRYQREVLALLIEPEAVTATGHFLSLLAAVEQLMCTAHAELGQ